jgi:hypothetical protein
MLMFTRILIVSSLLASASIGRQAKPIAVGDPAAKVYKQLGTPVIEFPLKKRRFHPSKRSRPWRRKAMPNPSTFWRIASNPERSSPGTPAKSLPGTPKPPPKATCPPSTIWGLVASNGNDSLIKTLADKLSHKQKLAGKLRAEQIQSRPHAKKED